MTLHYRIDGPEGAPPLVLLNGLFAGLESWDKAMAFLEGYRVLRYDGRGQGRSPKPEGVYSLDLLIEDLVCLLDELDWPSSLFAGISNGASVGLALAQRHPERVIALAAADCHHRVTPLLHLKVKSWLTAHETGGPTHRFDVATPWIWSESILEEHPEMIQYYRDRAALQEDQAVRGLIKGTLTVNVPVEEIDVPVLLLVGEEDLLTPPFFMRTMQIPRHILRTVKGGHASLLEHPSIFKDEIVPWFQGGCRVD